MSTNCDKCGREIEDDEVNCCPLCERDGLCDDCLSDHECKGTPSTPEPLAETFNKRRKTTSKRRL